MRPDFNDLHRQLKTMRRMGPIKEIMKIIPGLGGQISQDEMERLDRRRINRTEAIIRSMTPSERSNPDLIDGERRARIARGSGTTQGEVSDLIVQVKQMRR